MEKIKATRNEKIQFVLEIVRREGEIKPYKLINRLDETYIRQHKTEHFSILSDMQFLKLIHIDSDSNCRLDHKGIEALDFKGGYTEFKEYINRKEKLEEKHLSLQIALANKANQFFWWSTGLGVAGFIISSILAIKEIREPSQGKDTHLKNQTPNSIYIDEKSNLPISENDSSKQKTNNPKMP